MASRGAHPEDGDRNAGDWATRALGSRRRLRHLAVALWSSFLGAALTLLFVVALLPTDFCAQIGLGEWSVLFLAAWAAALVPVSIAMALLTPPSGLPRLTTHGR